MSQPRFAAWVRRHPDVVQRFFAAAIAERRAGQSLGAKAIAERLRYAPDVVKVGKWKVDNMMITPLAELAEASVPELLGYFRRRRTTAR